MDTPKWQKNKVQSLNESVLYQGHLTVSGGISDRHNCGRRTMLMASSRQRPGVLLNTLQCTVLAPHPQTKHYPVQNINRVEDEKPITDALFRGKLKYYGFLFAFVIFCSLHNWRWKDAYEIYLNFVSRTVIMNLGFGVRKTWVQIQLCSILLLYDVGQVT